jgi:putative PIN family toxin of toxin-antitoxin system
LRVVFDANVLIAAFISEGLCSKLLSRANKRYFDLYSSSFLISEFQKALKTKIGASKSEIKALTDLLIEVVMLADPAEEQVRQARGTCRDREDDPVLACALACKADYLVTGDRDLLEIKKFHKTKILSPREFELLFD